MRGRRGHCGTGKVLHGDCLDVLRAMPADSIDAIVSDPPAGIRFMGKAWDGDKGGRRPWIAWLAARMAEGLRVLKPGGYAFVWALPRTAHWTATALEDAGFEIRDTVAHVFGQGFPKSRALLKPAREDWILCRKPGPLRRLHIDACRINSGGNTTKHREAGTRSREHYRTGTTAGGPIPTDTGRWPANFVMSHAPGCERVGTKRVKGVQVAAGSTGFGEGRADGYVLGTGREYAPDEEVPAWECVKDGSCPVALMDAQSGVRRSACGGGRQSGERGGQGIGYTGQEAEGYRTQVYNDTGTASRFFHCFEADPFLYQAKASKKDRGEDNDHPTVKSRYLMAHLVRLIAAPGETVLDLFAGSGSTGVACAAEGMHFLGIEIEAASVKLARARLAAERTASLPAAPRRRAA